MNTLLFASRARRSGLPLSALLVFMAIIGIVASLLLPALGSFVGKDAIENSPLMCLAGDPNLVGQERKSRVAADIATGVMHLELNDSRPRHWEGEVHRLAGDVAQADGSVRQPTQAGLRAQLGQQAGPNPNTIISSSTENHLTELCTDTCK